MNGDICPCAVCEVRFAGCHAECEIYKTWRAEHHEVKSKRRKACDRNDLLVNFKFESIARMRRRHGK